MARVHIMMATYNGEKFIKEQIDSIINQTYQDWMLYISDDCSTDDTVNIIDDYCRQYPDKIVLLNRDKKLGGAKQNFLYLFDICPKAELYMFTDQDDVWLPEKAEKLVKKYDEVHTENCLVYCDLKVVDSDLNTKSESFITDIHYSNKKEFILMNNYVPGCVMLIDDYLREAIGILPRQCFMHDWWIVMYSTFFGNIFKVDESLHLYRQHSNNTIGAIKKPSFVKDTFNAIVHLFDSPVKRYHKTMEKSLKRLRKRKKQNGEFFKCFGDRMKAEDRLYYDKYLEMCSSSNRFKRVVAFHKFFKTNNITDNINLSWAVFRHKV
ncbi:MAG: glycosyltransferase family 2 protein [Eubacterium sp.]|nr:glycosyltransferase family 2 protein [Eubacterium sp.]